MKRDHRLHGLSSDHHHALVLARELSQVTGWSADQGAALQRRFAQELEPHFRIEEELLLPALRAAGCADLVDRTLADHAALRSLVANPSDEASARRFGALLQAHVRFEELEVFPACEARLPAGVLEEVARRAPKAT